ncbi:EamA family transporter RarD [Candidatus Formimonas warabiya]|uniref:EamA domain-containing protein n=1 Tax=Formimonas warabiya TaxID=1761012 RepID=A0A3G1KN72_FORW1|nr:EamA family transporter RarD [Candidatus Formimonas warabiya]ATW23907.1 hypothetical protein DCMF_03040 [Candidatus Formimonas warabiya]
MEKTTSLALNQDQKLGIRYALAAYGAWGLLPVYWKVISAVPAVQILAHRIFWSFIFVGGLLIAQKGHHSVMHVIRTPKYMLCFLASSLLLTTNWGVYIWANNHNHMIETSLGYFINPLVSILLGMIFLKEKIEFWQIVAVLLAGTGVSYMVFEYGKFPWIALILALTFGFYSLIRKVVPVESLTGLFIETSVMTPIAFIYLIVLGAEGKEMFFSAGLKISLLLIFAGVITAYPLMWLVNGAKRLPLKTIGFCQYLAPSLMLVIGVIIYQEPFTEMHRISFSFIWSALLIYSLSTASFMQKLNPFARREKWRGRL